jgi:nucleoside-diphosphate-sugar epimerase
VGCGYVGFPLGIELVNRGPAVFGLRRSADAAPAMAAVGIRPLAGDITKEGDLAKLPAGYDWVVNCVSSAKGGVEEYRAVYLQGTRNLITWLAPSAPKKFVYTSSTSVYGQNDGSLVTESSPTEPLAETAEVLLEAEQVLREAARDQKFPAVVLRLAGIYGPERGYWLKQYLKNEARIEGKGDRILNMIHRDDAIGVIMAALERGRPGEVYNVVDDEPVTQLRLLRWLSERFGTPERAQGSARNEQEVGHQSSPSPQPSPLGRGRTEARRSANQGQVFSTQPETLRVGAAMPAVAKEVVEGRKREITSKRISNEKLKKELGYEFRYPTFREGFEEELRRIGRGLDV